MFEMALTVWMRGCSKNSPCKPRDLFQYNSMEVYNAFGNVEPEWSVSRILRFEKDSETKPYGYKFYVPWKWQYS